MNGNPHPSELKVLIHPGQHVDEIRSLFCPVYDACLDEALRQGWNSWSCVGCDMFAHPNARIIDRYAQRRTGQTAHLETVSVR